MAQNAIEFAVKSGRSPRMIEINSIAPHQAECRAAGIRIDLNWNGIPELWVAEKSGKILNKIEA